MTDPPAEACAVLIPVYAQQGRMRIVLVERGAGGVHGGQVSLPGGKWEPGDASLFDTALREAEEEIGLHPSAARLLAALDPVDARTSGFRVHPYLVRVPDEFDYVPRAGEIARVITAEARWFVDPARRGRRSLAFPTWPEPRWTDCVALDGPLVVWGLTLRILDAAVPRLLAGEWPGA
jgi:8-oxo-dGTP pyrophosphatase MutT (NUDIX family)